MENSMKSRVIGKIASFSTLSIACSLGVGSGFVLCVWEVWVEHAFAKRKGIFLVAIAPVLFLLSGLFLANTLVYPAESIPYQAGQLLCFVIAPILFIAGIIIYVTARRA
jgi:hypothetical protein